MSLISPQGYDFTKLPKPLEVTELNLAIVSVQEIADWISYCLLLQGKKAANELGRCHYRGLGNTKCAGGHLISDENYTSRMEGWALERALQYGNDPCPDLEKIGKLKFCLIRKLQYIHDNIAPANWAHSLSREYEVFDLDTEFLSRMAACKFQ